MLNAKWFVKNEELFVFRLAYLRTIVHNQNMIRRVNRKLLDEWVRKNGPDGISLLAVESQVSAETIKKSRASGQAPKKLITCKLISTALGVAVDDLFPPVEDEAS